MKYTISVSKTYKHRGRFRHKLSTKKHWFHYFYEYDEIDERMKMYCKQVGWLKAMYYKGHKWKKVWLPCPDCQTTYLHFVKKRTDKAIGKEECPDCFKNFKDLYEEYLENS